MFYPSLILHSAKIYTVDESRPWAEAVAISGRHISAIGDNEEILSMSTPETELLDLEGRLVLPGLCDAHIHFHEWSLGQQQLKLAEVGSKAEMLRAVRKWASEQRSDSWIVGRGWNETVWPEKVMPTRVELDQVTGGQQPCIFWRSDMHCAVVNSRALEIASISKGKQDPDGGVIGWAPDGSPDGRLFELAINLITPFIPVPDPIELEEVYSNGMRALHTMGITAIHSQRMKDQTEGPSSLSALLRLRERDTLQLRVNHNIAAHDIGSASALGLRGGFGDDYLRLGHVKLFTDGTLGSKTAWMLKPLDSMDPGDPHAHGICLTPISEMAAVVEEAGQMGFPVSIHAIGDRANREVLDLLEELSHILPASKISNRIEHVQIIDPVDVPRLAELKVTASLQPIHALDDMDIADNLLGERSNRAYNFGSLVNSGALVAFGSDAPVADPNPFLGFHAAIYRQRPDSMSQSSWQPEERLTLEQTIHAYTLGAAIAGGWQDVCGSISTGKLADMIVLDRDLFTLIEEAFNHRVVADTRVLVTIFDGRIVIDQRQYG